MKARILTVALIALLVAVPAAIAAFTATTSYSGHSFTSAAIYPGAIKMATGSYAGTGADDVPIAVGFQPDYVIVKDTGTREGIARTSTMSGDASKPMGTATGLVTDRIQSFTATGFVVGANNQVNQSGRTYHWTAFKANGSAMKVGSYTGNATGQSLNGVGFSPEYVVVFGATAQRPALRFAGMTRSYRFDAGTGTTTGITSLDADGFTVGAGLDVNAAATEYHYVAFNDFADSIEIGSYAGDGADDKSIGGVNFQPEYVHIRAEDTVTARPATQRPASLAGDSTLFFAGSAAATNRIQALQAAGFQVGSSGDVNASTVTYHYLALHSTAP